MVMGEWMSQAPQYKFVVHNAQQFEQVQAFADAIGREVPDAQVRLPRFDNSIGEFTLTFKGSAADLQSRITRLAANGGDVRKGKVTEVRYGKIVYTFE
jgi:hypothetical protein